MKLSASLRPILLCLALFAVASGVGFLTGRDAAAAGAGDAAPTVLAFVDPAPFAPPPELAPELAPAPEPEPELLPEPVAVAEPTPLIQHDGELAEGQTLSQALQRHGVSARAVHLIATEMRPVFDFRYARAGDRYRLEEDFEGRVVRFRYERSQLDRFVLQRIGEEYFAARHEPEYVRQRARIAGIISTSLYDAIESLGERPELAHDFASIFAWDVDFSTGSQPGDEFSILYERLYLASEDGEEESYVRPGRILAARYTSRDDAFRAVHFQNEEHRGGYYRPDGSAVERQFLRAPLQYQRISSAFSMSRMHPILKIRRPHPGIDYAASTGTPVWSVAGGQVVFMGPSGGFGNLVKVRHPNGYLSYYGHLSRFAKDLEVGSRVAQKQVVGYVGATGLATGPHLDFRLKKDGRFVNPASLRTPAGAPIPEDSRDLFAHSRDDLLHELDPPSLVVMSEAL